MASRLLCSALKIYSYIYFILMMVTPLFVVGSVGALFLNKSSQPDLGSQILYPSLSLLIGSVLFGFWWRILTILSLLFDSGKAVATPKGVFFKRLYGLFLAAFFFDFLSSILDRVLFHFSTDWNKVQMPTGKEAWPVELWHWLQWLLKGSVTSGFFLTPRTTGLSTLFIAGVFYYLYHAHTIGQRSPE
jgi:hypothetical protein